MPNTYRSQIVLNLKNLLGVAVVHPRLALVGVQSEFESVLQEISPDPLIQRWVTDYDTSRRDYPKTAAIQVELGRYFSQQPFQANFKQLADDARHSRTQVYFSDVLQAVQAGLSLVDTLADRNYLAVFFCERDKIDVSLDARSLYDAAPGSTVRFPCPHCGQTLWSQKISYADENRGFGPDERPIWEAALPCLREAMPSCLLHDSYWLEQSELEDDRTRKLLNDLLQLPP